MSSPQRRVAGLAAAAGLIAVLTALTRLTGFARVFVFNATVGTGCSGAAYAAANQVPNVLFDVVAGGALAAAVVPVLAGQLADGRQRDADRTASALLGWVLLGLLPLAAVLALAAGPLAQLLVNGSATAADCRDGAALVALTARMLVVFAPQLVFYGLGVVLTGVLQARHRFTGPALAPLLSSLVVIACYLGFAALGGGPHGDPTRLPGRGPELVLSVGTSLGVVALSLPLLLPVRRSGVRMRPTLRFPDGVARRLRGFALAGVGGLLAQQAAVAVALVLTTRYGGAGALNAVQYLQAVYLLPYAVLVVPVATAVFPRLSEAAAAGRRAEFDRAAAGSTRLVIMLGLLGTAVLAAVAPAVQALFVALDVAGGLGLRALGEGLTWFALGLPGWALVAQLTRTLYALDRPRPAAVATAAGWALAAIGAVAAVIGLRGAGLPGMRAGVVGIAAATSAGMLLAGGLLLPAVRRAAGPGALTGVRRAAWVGLLATLVGAVAGRLVTGWLLAGRPATGACALVAGLLGGAPAVAGFALVGWWFEAGAPARPPGRAPRVLLVLATSGGGVGRHVAALARWLHDHDVPVRVAGPAATDADFGLSTTGASFSPVRIADRPHPAADLRAVLRLRGLAGGVDVIHAHGLRAGALAVLAARTRRRRPRLLVTLHNALIGTGRTALAHRALTRIVARGADQLLAVSPDLGAQLRARGARRVEAALVPAPAGAVRTPADQVRARLGIGPGERLLVTVARLAPQKGLDLLLDAVGRLPADVRVRAVIAGGGPLEGTLAARIVAERLPVTLLGWRDDVPDLLAAADVVIVPSVWEGQPLVVQEALRLGAPVLATDVGGVRQLTGEGAVLVPSGDPDALGAALSALLTNPTAMATLRDSSLRQGQRLPTDDDAGRQVLQLYRRLLRHPSAAGPGRPGLGGGEPADSLKARGAADS